MVKPLPKMGGAGRRPGKKRSAQISKDTPAPKRAKVKGVTAQGHNFKPSPEDRNESDDDDGGGGGGGPAFVANPALRGQPAVNEYFSTHKAESTRPTEEVLNQFEHDARAARLMMYEKTGFDLDNASILLENARSPDPEVRTAAREELAREVRGVGPDLSQKNEIRDLFYSHGGDHSQLLQCCACCGARDYQHVLNAKHYQVNDEWCKRGALLHLSDAEKAKYVYSRVAGYLNLTVLKFVALAVSRGKTQTPSSFL
jgi:hypothetical protein